MSKYETCILKELSPEAFDAFAKTHPLSNFWQTSMMAGMQQKKGSQVWYLGLEDEEGRILAGVMLSGTPLFMKGLRISAMHGPLLDLSNQELSGRFFSLLKDWLAKHGCLVFIMNPYWTYQEHDLEGAVKEDAPNGKAVHQYLADQGFIHEGFTTGIDLAREPRWIYTVPLKGKTPEELLASFERKTARSVKNAIKYNIQVRELGKDELHINDEILMETGERRGFSWREDSYHQNLYELFHPQNAIQFLEASIDLEAYKGLLEADLKKQQTALKQAQDNLARQDTKKMRTKADLAFKAVQDLETKIAASQELIEKEGKVLVLASGIFFTYGREVLCLMSGVKKEYAHFCAPYAMHWHMMNYAMEHGMERYNLYGMSGLFTPDAQDYGVYLFKKGFSGEILEMLGDYELPVQKGKYQLYQSLRNLKHKLKG